MNQRLLIGIIILAGIGSIGSVMAFSGTISAGQGNFNNVLVTNSCIGCSGSGTFSSYALIHNNTLSATADRPIIIQVGDDESTISSDRFPHVVITDNSGSLVSVTTPPGAYLAANSGQYQDQSPDGKYKIALNNTGSTVDVYKNNVLLQHIPIDTTHSYFALSQVIIGISENGKYIALYGPETTDLNQKLQIWQGS